MADLVDPDPPQAVEQINLAHRLGSDALEDRADRSPRHAHQLRDRPPDTKPERLARLARLRWKIELDYKQLKGELGLDHYEGRSWLGW